MLKRRCRIASGRLCNVDTQKKSARGEVYNVHGRCGSVSVELCDVDGVRCSDTRTAKRRVAKFRAVR